MFRGLTERQKKQLRDLIELSYITGDLFSYNKIVIKNKIDRSEIENIQEAVYYATHPKAVLEVQERKLLEESGLIKTIKKYQCPVCGSGRKQLYETTKDKVVCKDCIDFHNGTAKYIIIRDNIGE